MEEEELRIEEADIRQVIEQMVQVGAPQTLDVLTEWYIGAVIKRSAEQERTA